MTQEQNPQNPTAEATTDDTGSLDAAALAFEQKRAEVVPGQEQDAVPQEDAGAVEPDAEASDGEPDEATDTPTAELVEVEYDGITLSVAAEKAEAIQKALLRQADYSRKMNEVSAKEKAYTQKLEEAERFAEGVQQHAEALATVRLIDERLKSFDGINWQALRGSNPAEYAATAADVQTLRLAKAQAEQKAASVSHEVAELKTHSLIEKRDAMTKALETSLKGWGEEMGATLTKYATSNGVAFETLSQLTDPGLVVALHKAKQFDELQAAKAGVKAKLQAAPPVLKPGAARKTDAVQDSMARLRKSNTVDDAAAAFLSRMR
jgi:hypothetical protein